MNKDTLLIAALVLGAISSFGAGLHTWDEALTPSFVFGSIGAVAAAIKAYYSPRPTGGGQ